MLNYLWRAGVSLFKSLPIKYVTKPLPPQLFAYVLMKTMKLQGSY